ncbi:hypothetical protein [Xenorhabdus bovienii]|uniref:hypothetical protein n=1 Tax=Xenorhabdus bovienii TaxID=40576 RepID=UPI00056FDB2A|nr:hypothetical protein [Xenorhabdus bovienii]
MNTKNMLALKGAGDTGKTTTLKLLIELLKSSNDFTCVCQTSPEKKEWVAMFTINGIKVGISTAGDDKLTINRRVSKLIKLGCDIIISATRTWGKTVEAINELAKEYHYSLEWIDKSRADKKNNAEQLKVEQFKKNKSDADSLFNRINEIINNH